MKKEYIPYEQAFELRQLGYDDECTMYYAPGHPEGYYLVDATPLSNSHWMFTADDNKRRETMCAAPLYQQAFRWFREKYELLGTPQYFTGGFYCYTINDMKDTKKSNRLFTEFESFEEAELACLKKLIEIIKNK
jgi:hypothetical protein